MGHHAVPTGLLIAPLRASRFVGGGFLFGVHLWREIDVRVFPTEVVSGSNGHMNKGLHGQGGSDRPKLFAFERLIAGDLHSRVDTFVRDDDFVVFRCLSKSFDADSKLVMSLELF